jgi:hypothetical protein
MREMRNLYRITARKTNRRRIFGTPRCNETVILKPIISKQGARLCTGFK